MINLVKIRVIGVVIKIDKKIKMKKIFLLKDYSDNNIIKLIYELIKCVDLERKTFSISYGDVRVHSLKDIFRGQSESGDMVLVFEGYSNASIILKNIIKIEVENNMMTFYNGVENE